MVFKDIFIEEILNLGKGIASDSRQVQPGDIFVSIPCAKADTYIQQAINQGASAVVVDMNETHNWESVKIIPVLNPRLTLAKLSKEFYPHQPENTVAVTGTSGKSSVVHLTRQLWEGYGYKAASLGTLGLVSKEAYDLQLPSLTTLDPISLHKTLNTLGQKGISHFAFEASSHGLDQYRVHAVDLKAAGFTNFTQDHLDYHLTMEGYFLAKTKLFSEVLPVGRTAVLNKDSPFFDQLYKICQKRSQEILTYSLKNEADLSIQGIRQQTPTLSSRGAVGDVVISRLLDTALGDCRVAPAYVHPPSLKLRRTRALRQGKSLLAMTPTLEFGLNILGQHYSSQKVNLAGQFQLENLLCSLGLAIATGAPIPKLIETLPLLTAVTGRMEWVGSYNNAAIYVDYSHKPDALKTALENLRIHTKGQLWVVFGCGGNRDALKRPKMGAIACEYADHVIVTDDNPRYEDPAFIRQQILAACPKAIEIADRRQAIRSTIAQSKEGDVVLIAGKGHETGQIIGDVTYPFDDQIEVETFLKECMNV